MPVYVIRAGNTEMVKLGWADDVESRRRDLQTAHYEPLHIIRVFEGPPRTERWLHRYFAERRVRGEWFRFLPEMLTVEIGLQCPAEMDVAEQTLLATIEDFLRASGMNATEFGRLSINDPCLVHNLRQGRECRRATRQRITNFITLRAAA